MANKKFFGVMLVMVLILGLVLTGCPIDTNDIENQNKSEMNVQIYNKNDGSLFFGNGVVNASIHPWNGDIWTVQAGTISNGILNFSFPTTIPDEKLEPFWGEFEHPNAFITPENTKYCGIISTLRFPFIVYNSSGEKSGELTYGKIIKTDSGYIGDVIYFFYFNQDVTISGSFTFPPSTENYQINAKKGWNRIYIHETNVNNNILSIFSTDLKNVPSDLKWEFSGNNIEDNNGGNGSSSIAFSVR